VLKGIPEISCAVALKSSIYPRAALIVNTAGVLVFALTESFSIKQEILGWCGTVGREVLLLAFT